MVRQVHVRMADGSVRTLDGVEAVEVWFGPHYVVQVDSGHCTLIATHHGVGLPATEVGRGLEDGIAAIRAAAPETGVDGWESISP